MYIKLEFKNETKKAYQLKNDSWIPKSILDDSGLKYPYFQLKGWWLSKSYGKIREEQDESVCKVFKGIEPMVIKLKDIPKDVREDYVKYWSNYRQSNYRQSNYEPNIWENDSLEGEMSSWH